MRDVAIIGVGQTPVGEHWDASLRMLAADAVRAAIEDAGTSEIDALYVGNAYGGVVSSQSQIAPLIADGVGGGDVDAGSLVTEEYLMAMERDRFCSLLEHPKTQERIMGMLSTGKPVRN